MKEEDLRRLLRVRPFQPFRVIVNDGRVFEVHYPYMNLLARSYVKIGIPKRDQPHLCDYTEYVPLSAIVRVEPLAGSPTVS